MKEYNIYYHHVVIRAAVCVASRCCRAAAPTITQNRFVGVAAMNVQRTGGAFRRTTNNRKFRVSGRRAFPSTRSKPSCHYSDFPDTFYPRNASCRGYVVVYLSVRPSVRPSQVGVLLKRITQTTPHDSTWTAGFRYRQSRQNSNGVTPITVARCKLATFDAKRCQL